MTFAKFQGEDILFIFGSGSKPKKRDKLIIVFPEREHSVLSFSLEEFYNVLREKEIPAGNKLNIEAAAANSQTLYLFHRGNISGKNLVFSIPLIDFTDYVLNEKKDIPLYSISSYILPSVNKIISGFSGASMLDKTHILFSASVEDTENEMDDGAVLGSFIGILNPETKNINCELLKEGIKILSLKVESICLIKSKDKTHILYAITDSDGGASELLELELTE